MNDWNSGYTTDIDYTFGYYPELNPARIRLAVLDAGLVCPEVGTACELGFGQGVSVNVHAAASVTRWSGTDFNPAQASFARALGAASGAEPQLHDDAFAEFCTRVAGRIGLRPRAACLFPQHIFRQGDGHRARRAA